MAEFKKTSLNAGLVVRQVLMGSEVVRGHTGRIFPVVTDEAELPYIVYRRLSLDHSATKAGYPGADTVRMEVSVFTEGYGEGVELAEAVRQALDYSHGEAEGVRMRSCVLSDAEELWQDDAFVQNLVFTIKI